MQGLFNTFQKLLGKVLPSKKANPENKVVRVSSKSIYAQSAMEYLMTYGWSILLISVTLAGLFELGVFNGNGSSFPTSCISQPGFLCSNPIMDTNGNVLITFGQSSGLTITVQATACSNSSAAPSPTMWVQQPVNNPSFVTGFTGTLGFQCILPSNTVGTKFSGTLWIQYQKGGVSGQEAEIGIFTAKAGTFNLQTSLVCAFVNTPDSEMFLSGLKSTTLTTTQSCGATNFQWYEEAPGASSFSEISGATSSTYLFSLSSGATTGTYQFDVQTSNNQGNQATSTPINVIVTNDPYAYVSNFGSNNVSIVDVTTGNVLDALDAITSGVSNSRDIAFYSGNAYVANFGSGNVVEINPSNGGAIGSWTSGFNGPFGIAFPT